MRAHPGGEKDGGGAGTGAWSGLGAFQPQVTPVAAGDRTEGLPAGACPDLRSPEPSGEIRQSRVRGPSPIPLWDSEYT